MKWKRKTFQDILIKTATKVCDSCCWNKEIKRESKKKKPEHKRKHKLYKRQRIKVKKIVFEAKKESWETFAQIMEQSSKENVKLFYIEF